MNPRWWQLWGKWAFIGFLLLAIVMTVSSGDGWGTAKMAAMRQEQPAGIAYAQQKLETQPALAETRVELERMDAAALQRKVKRGGDNAFSPTSWYVPPPPPLRAKPLLPLMPTAPPMPFSYLGFYEEAPGKVIMLVKGGQVYTVSVGDVIEKTYRIDRVEHGMVEITYLPLNITQSISTGNPS